jgi:hypothetical protein
MVMEIDPVSENCVWKNTRQWTMSKMKVMFVVTYRRQRYLRLTEYQTELQLLFTNRYSDIAFNTYLLHIAVLNIYIGALSWRLLGEPSVSLLTG